MNDAARLEDAQRNALYAELYALLAIYHRVNGHPRERWLQCMRDGERCRRRAIELVFGPLLDAGERCSAIRKVRGKPHRCEREPHDAGPHHADVQFQLAVGMQRTIRLRWLDYDRRTELTA
jgi:hypothetical protein